VLEFVKSIYNGKVLENDRIQLEGKELDIFIPSLNLGIEFDGDYWHTKEDAKEKDERKNQLCEEKGIRLLRIKESDWDSDRTQIEEKIKEFIHC
jgi:very-short-patch-repair endonuclease